MKQGTLEKIQNLAVNLQLVTVEDMRKHSLPQLVTMIANKLNELMNEVHRFETDVIEMVETQNENIQYLLGEGLHLEVATVFENWMEDGTFDTLINQTALNEINHSINMFHSQLSVNIKDLGVKGDGSDETLSIQSAIDFCVENGHRELYFPDGIYSVSKTIDLKGVKIKGNGSFIPFLLWDYTRENGLELYHDYLRQCRGSIITSSQNITILKGKINIEKIGIFGNRRMSQQDGILVDIECNLKSVEIKGMGRNAINMTYGAINPIIEHCFIEQNGKYGLIFGDSMDNGYTGETNRVTINYNSFNRNEMGGIYGVCRGRHFIIDNNTFEAIGEPSDPDREKPTNVHDIKYGIELTLKNTNNWTNGSVNLTNNYLEETYGFAKIICENPVKSIIIENTMWQPFDQINYSCFTCFSGYIDGLKITNNNVYTQKDYIKFIDYNVRNFITDLKSEYTPNVLSLSDMENNSNSVYWEIESLAYQVVHQFPSGFITSLNHDNLSYRDFNYVGEMGVTYLHYNPSKLNGYDLGNQGVLENYNRTGYGLIVGGNFMGIVIGKGSDLLIVRGNRTTIPLGDGSAKLIKLPGAKLLNGGGGHCKIVYDHDLTPLPFGK